MPNAVVDGFEGKYKFLANSFPLDKPIVEKLGQHAKMRYPTVRKAYHAQRTDDLTLKAHIIAASPGADIESMVPEEKERKEWNVICERVMLRLLREKFSESSLKQRLLETGDATLIHRDPRDRFWGVNRVNVGENRLGRLLMSLRAEFQREHERTAKAA